MGFKGKKIYRIYVPSRRDIVRTLYVTFNKSSIITSIGSSEDKIPAKAPSIINTGRNRNRDVTENPSANNADISKVSINKDIEKIRLKHDNTFVSDDEFADTIKTLRIIESNNEQGVTVPKLTKASD